MTVSRGSVYFDETFARSSLHKAMTTKMTKMPCMAGLYSGALWAVKRYGATILPTAEAAL